MSSPIAKLYGQKNDGPKYLGLAQAIRTAIEQGDPAPGDRLPPVRDLARQIGVTPGTVARSYALLSDQGILRATVGRGTFVAYRDASGPAARVSPEAFDLTVPRLPDMGQVALIRGALFRVGDAATRDMLRNAAPGSLAAARSAMLGWINGDRLGGLEADDIVLTQGTQAAIMTVMHTVLRGARPVVLVEELAHPGFRRAAELLRAEVVAVPMDGKGIDPVALAEIVQGSGARLLCTAPEVHDPTGICTPETRRAEIAAVAARHGLHVLESDVARLGAPAGPGYRALLPELGWYVSSLSVRLTPWPRAGIAIGPRVMRDGLSQAAAHGGAAMPGSVAALVADILPREDAFAMRDRVRIEIDRYMGAAADRLAAFSPAWRAGLPFLWLPMPPGRSAASLAAEASDQSITVSPAASFALPGAYAPEAVRLAVDAQASLACFTHAADRLAALLR